MNFYFTKSILTSNWQVDWLTFRQYYPMYRGILNGFTFGSGAEESNSIPYNIDLAGNAGNKKDTPKHVQIVPIRGIMMKHDMECGPKGMRTIGKRLTDGEKPDNVLGSILLFDSGGGQADSVIEIAEAIQACKKPVIAYIDGQACSAAMYAASYCKEIIASRPTDIVGSIGTMIVSEGFEKFTKDANGVTHFRVYADGSEDKNEEFESAIKGDFKLIKESILNPVNEQFKADIKANRPKVTESHLTGKTFKATEVIGILVDSIGTVHNAANRVAALASEEQQSKQSTKLNMEKFPLLLAVLGTTELAIPEGQSSLNTDQLEAIEKALEADAKAKTELIAANTNLENVKIGLQQAADRIAILETELAKKPGAESLESGNADEPENKGPFKTRYDSVLSTLKNLS